MPALVPLAMMTIGVGTATQAAPRDVVVTARDETSAREQRETTTGRCDGIPVSVSLIRSAALTVERIELTVGTAMRQIPPALAAGVGPLTPHALTLSCDGTRVFVTMYLPRSTAIGGPFVRRRAAYRLDDQSVVLDEPSDVDQALLVAPAR